MATKKSTSNSSFNKNSIQKKKELNNSVFYNTESNTPFESREKVMTSFDKLNNEVIIPDGHTINLEKMQDYESKDIISLLEDIISNLHDIKSIINNLVTTALKIQENSTIKEEKHDTRDIAIDKFYVLQREYVMVISSLAAESDIFDKMEYLKDKSIPISIFINAVEITTMTDYNNILAQCNITDFSMYYDKYNSINTINLIMELVDKYENKFIINLQARECSYHDIEVNDITNNSWFALNIDVASIVNKILHTR